MSLGKPLLLVCVGALAAAACLVGCAGNLYSRSRVAEPVWALDSAERVRLGIEALVQTNPVDKRGFMVSKFERDESGVTIELVPKPVPGTLGSGGGGRVRVVTRCQTKVLEINL